MLYFGNAPDCLQSKILFLFLRLLNPRKQSLTTKILLIFDFFEHTAVSASNLSAPTSKCSATNCPYLTISTEIYKKDFLMFCMRNCGLFSKILFGGV